MSRRPGINITVSICIFACILCLRLCCGCLHLAVNLKNYLLADCDNLACRRCHTIACFNRVWRVTAVIVNLNGRNLKALFLKFFRSLVDIQTTDIDNLLGLDALADSEHNFRADIYAFACRNALFKDYALLNIG